jgi:hypothetical protein
VDEVEGIMRDCDPFLTDRPRTVGTLMMDHSGRMGVPECTRQPA